MTEEKVQEYIKWLDERIKRFRATNNSSAAEEAFGEACRGDKEKFLSLLTEATTTGKEKYLDRFRDAVQDAINGLEWRNEEIPESMDKSDYEKLEEWKALLTAYDLDIEIKTIDTYEKPFSRRI